MIDKFYYCVTSRDGVIINTALRYGRFLGYKHFVALLTHWSGNCADVDYFYYPARDRREGEVWENSLGVTEPIDHTTFMPHLSR